MEIYRQCNKKLTPKIDQVYNNTNYGDKLIVEFISLTGHMLFSLNFNSPATINTISIYTKQNWSQFTFSLTDSGKNGKVNDLSEEVKT